MVVEVHTSRLDMVEAETGGQVVELQSLVASTTKSHLSRRFK